MPPSLEQQGEHDFGNYGQDGLIHEDAGLPNLIVSDVLNGAASSSALSFPDNDELDEQLNSGAANHGQQIITPDEQPAPLLPEEMEAPVEPEEPVAPYPDMDIPEGELADDELPVPDEPGPAAVASAKKRGRPSATPGKAKTPSAKTKTPRTAATTNGDATASRATGRKRKASEDDEELAAEATPAKRPRGRPAGRSAADTASPRLAAKSANKPKRGRPKGSAAAAPKAKVSKRGGSKNTSGESSSGSEAVPKGEYEVEEILDSVIDADTFEHMYHVKWKGYPLSEATWEPKTNLGHASALIKAFDAHKKSTSEGKTTRGAAKTNGEAAAPKKAAPKAAAKATKAKAVKKVGRPAKKAGRPPMAGRSPKKLAAPPAGRSAGRPRKTV